MSYQSNNIQIKQEKQDLFGDFFRKHEQENNVNDIEQAKQIFSDLKKELRKLKKENTELREQNESYESSQKNFIKTNEDFEAKINGLQKDLTKEKKKNKKIEFELKKESNSQIEALRAEFDKERKQLLKNINQLQNKINSNSTIKAPEPKIKIINRFESLNSEDFSQLCDTISINSSNSSPRTSKHDSIQSNTKTSQRKRNSSQISSNQSVFKSKYDINYCELSESEPEETTQQPKKRKRGHNSEELKFNDCSILSESIWESFSPKKIESGVFFLKRKQMSQEQRQEIDILDKFMEGMIIRNFYYKTRTKIAAKIVDGYSIRRYCSANACTVSWSLNINIKTGEGTIFCSKKCGHLMSAKERRSEKLCQNDLNSVL